MIRRWKPTIFATFGKYRLIFVARLLIPARLEKKISLPYLLAFGPFTYF